MCTLPIFTIDIVQVLLQEAPLSQRDRTMFRVIEYCAKSLSSLFHAGQAAIKLPSGEASKLAQCTSSGQYTPYIKGIIKTP